jgi:hypothetical protein
MSTNPSDTADFFLPEDRLYLATRAFVLWLQGLYGSRPAGMLKWNENDSESEILIFSGNPTELEDNNTRPFISVLRGPAVFSGISPDVTMSRNFVGDKRMYTDTVFCSLAVNCVAREGVEAQEMAYTIARMLIVFKASIMRLGRIHAIGNEIQISGEGDHNSIVPGSSTPEWRVVQVGVPIYVQDVVSSEANNRGFHNILRAVNLHMGLE